MTSQTKSPETPVSAKVVQKVATITNQNMTQLPPLYNTIDPEALDTIVDIGPKDSASTQVQFTYAECRITVNDSQTVIVEKSE